MILRPERVPNEVVVFETCAPERACLDKTEMKKLIKNRINTESYLKQLETLLNTLSDPIKGKAK